MKTIKLLLFLPLLTSAYNLAPDRAIVYAAPPTENRQGQAYSSYFGYNVLLHYSTSTNKSWIIVGAPKANYLRYAADGIKVPVELGVTYRCSLSGNCEPINIRKSDDEVGFIEQVGVKIFIKKEHGWFGASMSLREPSTSLTICAPRTIVRIYNSVTARYHNTMHGVCYEGDLFNGDLHIEDKNLTTFDFTSKFWYNPMNGFAVHDPLPKAKTEGDVFRSIVGSPKRELYGTVNVIGKKKPTKLPIADDLAQFGYALTSGYYFHEDQLIVAGAAPGWQYVGQVGLMDPQADPVPIISTIAGKQIGEYFGACLATGDINNDGLDDLIVGSPHWKNDNGRVHIFLGNKAGFIEADFFIEGCVDDGLFGYAITSGDLDGDGNDDIIIGAPWEEAGVIYVYNGDSKLTRDTAQEVRLREPAQRIAASSIRKDLLRFGYSLAKPVDMDNNGFLDIGVGAYASGHAVILLSRPVTRSEITVSTIPATLPRNATSFVRQLCVKHFEKTTPLIRIYIINQAYDENYKRVLNPSPKWLIYENICTNETFKLLKDIRNYIDPIDITITHEYENSNHTTKWKSGYIENCTLCPIEYKGVPLTTVRTKLAFDIGCGKDDICHAFITANLQFPDIRNSTWIIGSGDLRLMLLIDNFGEPAYLTTVTFDIPEGISLRSILPSCQEERDRDTFKVTCDIGNPLGMNTKKNLSLDFDMSGMNRASVNGTDVIFHVDINTRSINRGVKRMVLPLHLMANISVVLSGKAYDDSYYFNYNSKPSKVSLQHIFQITRFGVTPISEVRLTIRIPYKLGNLKYLTILHKPRVSILGRFYECSVSGVSVSKPQIFVETGWTEKQIENELHLDSIDNLLRARENRTKPDTIPDEKLSNWSESDRNNNNTPSEFYTLSNSSNVNAIYLNCSTASVSCGLIVCNIPSLKRAQDVVKLQLRLVIDNGKLTDDSNDRENVVHFSTEARVDVQNPMINFSIPGTGLVVPVTTTFHRPLYVKKEISIWIILGSVWLGLLTLCFLAITLRKIGFFKRGEKEKLESLKRTEAIPLDTAEVST